MFKLESYITPILLSYVNKFIKNFKPEDSQLSLWGGEASFQNLDLRLEVLEEELQLPFSFVSGHIHELLIHVPWTKLTSEPIRVTINTIECILKLHGEDIGADGTTNSTANSGREVKRRAKRQPEQIAAPPGYVQTLANKIVSNITINCTNLIVKYVEEDIVMSMNVKNLTYQSANQRWEPEFSDYLPTQLILRKLINMTDVTVCLDKRNASGKIDSYQEPLLYKCSLTMHLFRMYSSPSAQQAYVTRLDVFCQKMMFNVSEVQVPMMMRLMLLGLALQNREIGPNKLTHADPDMHVDEEEEREDNDGAGPESWAGWAWSFVPSLPVGWNEDWDEDENKNRISTFHFGFYIEELGFSLRISDSGVSDRGMWKTKLEPFLTLTLNGCVLDMVIASRIFFNTRMGVCSVKLEPVSQCCCGAFESDGNQEAVYLLGGNVQDQYTADSLFSPTSAENQGKTKEYCLSWDQHLETMTEAVLLEKTPAIAMDYLYTVDLPEDFPLEKLVELGLDLEYSNLPERSLCRTVVGPSTLRINSGLVHRMGRLLQAASHYDYQPYSVPKPDERRELLLTVTTEEYDSLEGNIPLRIHQFTVFQPMIIFQLANHPIITQPSRRKMSSVKQTSDRNLPAVQIGCKCLDAKLIRPMYPRRLVRTACQLPHLPEHMFNCCHVRCSVRVLGLEASLSQGAQSHKLAKSPENVSFERITLLLPYLWNNADLSHRDDVWKISRLSLTAAKPQLLLTQRIISSLFSSNAPKDSLFSSSLVRDAMNSEDIAVLEAIVGNCSWRAVVTSSTRSYTLLITYVQAQITAMGKSSEETKTNFKHYQVLTTQNQEKPFITGCLQWPISVDAVDHPPLLALCLGEVDLNLSPFLCIWVLYEPVNLRSKAHLAEWSNQRQTPSRKISEPSQRQSSIEKAVTAQESAHSSSDRDILPPLPMLAQNSTISMEPPIVPTDQNTAPKEGLLPEAWLVEWYHVWINVMVNIEVGRCHVLIPYASPSSDTQSVHLELPVLHVRSATPPNKQTCQLQVFPLSLPFNLPEGVWNQRSNNFPWNVTFTDCSARTLINDEKLDLLRPFSVNCTVAISTRFTNGDQLTALGLCIHNDTTPVHISASRAQVQLLCGVFVGLSALGGSMAKDFIKTGKTSTSQTCSNQASLLSPTTLSETASASDEKGWNTVCERDSSESLKLTMWLQWTLTRLTATLYHFEPDGSKCKLVMDWEDFMSSLDLQQVYCKLKWKVAGVSVRHYTRDVDEKDWRLSPVHGVVMKCREGSLPTDAGQVSTDEGCGFLNVTFTRAKCRNAHSRWGAGSTPVITGKRFTDGKVDSERLDPTSCFISEVVAKMQPIDVVISPKLLVQMGLFVSPLWQLPVRSDPTPNLTSCTLPLLYLDLQALRIILPVVGSAHGKDDTYIFQVDSIVLSPHAENPLLRTPLRPDIYHMAEQARILTVPGSEVEDRQHELTVSGLAIRTGEWREIDLCQKSTSAASSLRTMSENPALVWNTLDQDSTSQDGETLVSQGAQPKPRLSNVLLPVKIIVVAAPAVIFHERVLICGHALEINAVNGLEIVLTCSQLNLGVSLLVETRKAVDVIRTEASAGQPILPSFMTEASLRQNRFQHTPTECELSVDSGVDTGDLSSVETSNVRSHEIGKTGRKYSRVGVSGRVDGVIGSYSTHSAPTAYSRPRFCEKDNYTSYSAITTDWSAVPDSPSIPRSSDVMREFGRPSHISKESRNVVPFDVLLTGSKIVLMLYQDQSNEVINGERTQDGSNMVPLLYTLLSQPYISFSLVSRNHKMQASLYNTLIKLGSNICAPHTEPVVLNDSDFPQILVETRKGDPDLRTGILPAFFTLQWTLVLNKPAVVCYQHVSQLMKLYNSETAGGNYTNFVKARFESFPKLGVVIDMGRPTKFVVSKANLDCLMQIQKVLVRNLESAIALLSTAKSSPERPTRSGVEQLREMLVDISCVTLKTVQLMLVLQTDDTLTSEAIGEFNLSSMTSTMTCSSGSRWGMAAQNVERISLSAAVDGVSVALSYRQKRHFFLEPCCFDSKLHIMWPMWFQTHKLPIVQLSATAGCVDIALGTDHLHSMLLLWNSYEDFLSTAPSTASAISPLPPHSRAPSDVGSNETGTDSVDTEQHYTDDLRAGAFQFLDATENMSRDELPLPYQCVFWESGPPAMAWRYPQPRVITHMDVFPVPFKVSEDDEYETSAVVCSLQYWSECHAAFQPLATFLLSENEGSQLTLASDPGPAVSTTWRILVAGSPAEDSMDSEQDLWSKAVSPRALAACIRINSFFSANLVPWFQGSFNIALLQVSLYNHLSNHVIRPMPKVLEDFHLDSSLPTTHSFLWLSFNKASFFSAVWPGGRLMSECNSMVRAECMDYATYTQQSLIEAFSMQGTLSRSQNKQVDLSAVSKPIAIRYGPSTAHTCAVSAQLWIQEWLHPDEPLPQVIVSRYAICNDTALPLRFSQIGTEEDIPLLSRQCHFYAWKTHCKERPQLRVALIGRSPQGEGARQGSAEAGLVEAKKIWSRPFSIDTCGTQRLIVHNDSKWQTILLVKITALSAMQKKVIFSGQLVVCNQLSQQLEVRVMRPSSETFGCVVPVESERIGPTLFIDKPIDDSGLFIRVRFPGATLWTGDIPLNRNTKGNHPWLVKVPLQEKSQSRTVWCRVLREAAEKQAQILVVISPLYALKSFLPGPIQLLVETPTLGTSTSLEVKGCSSVQELGCLGSLEHEHQLRIQVQPLAETVPSQSFKLSYDCFDQSQLSSNSDKLDFDAFLKEFEESKRVLWPLPEVETARLAWATAGHHDSDIKVTFAHECIHAGTLMVEIRPWVLFLNVLSKPIQIFSGGSVVCTMPPKSAVVPPRLEGTFQLGLQLCGTDWHMTESLQLARADRGKSFYMPRIAGLIPTDGHIATILNGPSMVSLLNIKSQVHQDMRVVSIRPSFVICNNTPHPIRVTAFAICHLDLQRRIAMPVLSSPSVQAASFIVQPDAQNRGYPIEKWFLLKSCDAPIIPYVALSSLDGDLLGCPMRLNTSQHRGRFSVPLSQPVSLPGKGPRVSNCSLVLCVVDRGDQTFATIMEEPHPQLIVHNQCNFVLMCAQGIPSGASESAECKILPDAAHFDWFTTVPPNCQAQYTFPTEDESFPLLPSGCRTAYIVLAVKSQSNNSCGPWSGGVCLTESQEQYVNLPTYGDVKVRVWIECHTMNLSVEAVSRIEISARDIRSRLSAAPTALLKSSANFYEEDASGTSTGRRSTSSATTSEEENANLNEISYSSDWPRLASSITIAVFLQSLSVTLTTCESADVLTEITCLSMDRVGFTFKPIPATSSLSKVLETKVSLVVGDFQLDNQMFEQGGYDFPVVVLGQGGESKPPQLKVLSVVNTPALQLIEEHSRGALLAVTLTFERSYHADDIRGTVTKMLHLSIGPLTAFIEDTFVLQLSEHAMALLRPSVMYWAENDDSAPLTSSMGSPWVVPPLSVCWQTKVLSQPLRLTSFTVDPLWLLISVHSSVRMYLALDRSPLQFTQFSRRSICTTSYDLGHALTMHYLSGAIFGAGWVVGSLELLGSPGGFARTLGSGLKDFISLPYHGILQGPWGFLVGVTHGSASLMKHFTAGTLNSVTKMASSVARNLDRLTLDEEHLRRTEEMRRIRPQGVAQGLVQGLTGLGISLLGAVGGLAHHPLQCVMSGPATPRGLMTGVGRGLVGVFTKPLSGAADFVAMTGQGLLQGAGWTDLPQKRQSARPDYANLRSCAPLKYHVKMFPTLVREAIANGYLLVTEATRMRDADSGGIQGNAVTLALTTKALIIFSATNDMRESIFSLEDLVPQEASASEDDTRLIIYFKKAPPQVDMRIWEFLQGVPTLSNSGPPTLDVAQDLPPTSLPAKLPLSLQMLEHRLAGPDVEDTVNPNLNLSGSEGSETGGINESITTSPGPSNLEASPPRPPMVFLVNPQFRSRFELAFYIAHRQYHGGGFPVL